MLVHLYKSLIRLERLSRASSFACGPFQRVGAPQHSVIRAMHTAQLPANCTLAEMVHSITVLLPKEPFLFSCRMLTRRCKHSPRIAPSSAIHHPVFFYLFQCYPYDVRTSAISSPDLTHPSYKIQKLELQCTAPTKTEPPSQQTVRDPDVPMSAYKDFLGPNAEYVANFGQKSSLSLPPAKKLIIITCMDARINVYAELGISEGDAHIIRNAGGSAKDALRSVIISQRLLGTREIAVFHHTGCGMLTFTSAQLRDIIKDSNPSDPSLKVVDHIDFLEFSNLEQSIREDVKFLQESPLVLSETAVTGWVYEVETGKIKQVV